MLAKDKLLYIAIVMSTLNEYSFKINPLLRLTQQKSEKINVSHHTSHTAMWHLNWYDKFRVNLHGIAIAKPRPKSA